MNCRPYKLIYFSTQRTQRSLSLISPRSLRSLRVISYINNPSIFSIFTTHSSGCNYYLIPFTLRFTEFSFHSNLLEGIEASGYETATPVQEQVIPPILAGKDIIAAAQTG